MFLEIDRCLVPFGRYIIVTLAQNHIIEYLVKYFWSSNRFIFRIQKCSNLDGDFIMPVFIVVVTKLKFALQGQPSLEAMRTSFNRNTTMAIEKFNDAKELYEFIASEQELNWYRHYVSQNLLLDESSIRLSGSNGKVRYSVYIVDDQNLKSLLSWAVFIVPLGRENDWLFSTAKGRNVLRGECHVHRLIVVILSPDQNYGSMKEITQELDAIVPSFKPFSCQNTKAEYLSYGTFDVREQIDKGKSPISGEWSVENVFVDQKMVRRLRFLGTNTVIQSEVVLKKVAGGNRWVIDHDSPLSCDHVCKKRLHPK